MRRALVHIIANSLAVCESESPWETVYPAHETESEFAVETMEVNVSVLLFDLPRTDATCN